MLSNHVAVKTDRNVRRFNCKGLHRFQYTVPDSINYMHATDTIVKELQWIRSSLASHEKLTKYNVLK